MVGHYTNFGELRQNERMDQDYTIFYRGVDSQFAIIAPHGGGIEPGTIDIADAIAGCDHSFYAFKGLKKTGNKILHISSNTFDEELALKAVQNALIVLSIHGSQEKTELVQIGGKNQELKLEIMHALRMAEFNAVVSEVPGLRGMKPENICNRCRSGKGVQLEISRGLREKMFDNLCHRSLRKKTIVFHKFVKTIKEVLKKSQ